MSIKAIKEKIRQRAISRYSSMLSADKIDENAVKDMLERVAAEVIGHEQISIPDEEKNKIICDLYDEFIGLGPIEDFLKDNQVTEIMINGHKNAYVERAGQREVVDMALDDERRLMQIIYKILTGKRRRVDETNPYTEVAIRDGSRVNIVIPPLAVDGPVITIRKFSKEIKVIEDLISLGTLDRRMADFLIAAIKAKLNIIFSGATGAGKTTALNVLSSYISDKERIITIEDTVELRLAQEHVVRLEARQVNIEGKGAISIRELFKNSLRMRPDRIIIGEIRGSEALDMLQAICSGHTGSLAVVHANSPQDVISRLEMMILTSGIMITTEVIHRQIANAINIIIQHTQFSDGSRKITNISQVNGLRDGRVVLEDVFVYEMKGIDASGKVEGAWRATGVVPAFGSIFKKAGIDLPQDIFQKG
ncbi:MAG: CpaF family protein [Candidatus Omnitrophica bacterium]|nr:CpaF family protein [Candidatus Omnitrophota bacterium]